LYGSSVIELTLNPPEGIVAGPINEENFFEWEALITCVFIIYCLVIFCRSDKREIRYTVGDFLNTDGISQKLNGNDVSVFSYKFLTCRHCFGVMATLTQIRLI
jgi:uncharacterized membrane protein